MAGFMDALNNPSQRAEMVQGADQYAICKSFVDGTYDLLIGLRGMIPGEVLTFKDEQGLKVAIKAHGLDTDEWKPFW